MQGTLLRGTIRRTCTNDAAESVCLFDRRASDLPDSPGIGMLSTFWRKGGCHSRSARGWGHVLEDSGGFEEGGLFRSLILQRLFTVFAPKGALDRLGT